MNADLREQILSHARSSKNGRVPLQATHLTSMTNPLCGDHVEIGIVVVSEVISEIGYKVAGCALCSAAADIFCLEASGKKIDSMLETAMRFEKEITEKITESWEQDLGGLNIFESVKTVPSRKMCVLLPSLTFQKLFRDSR